MSWMWQRLCSGKLGFLRDSCRQCLLAALSSELAWSRSDSPQPENAYGESERLGLPGTMNQNPGMLLTHWGQHKMNAILQITISNAFFLIKMYEFWLKLHWSFKIALKFVHLSQIHSISELLQIMTWHQPGDKPLSEAMMVCLLMHICISFNGLIH